MDTEKKITTKRAAKKTTAKRARKTTKKATTKKTVTPKVQAMTPPVSVTQVPSEPESSRQFTKTPVNNKYNMETGNINQRPVRKSGKGMMVKVILGLVVVALIAGGLYYRNYNSPEAEQARIEKENKDMLAEIGERMLLPQEEPVIYNIEDPALLASQQPFFTGSVEGDRLILFPQTAKAVIWSPERKVIVNVGPITFDNTVANEGVEQQPAPTTVPKNNDPIPVEPDGGIGDGAAPLDQVLSE